MTLPTKIPYYKKHKNGTIYPIWMLSPILSIIPPMMTGKMAPPMIAMTINEEAGFVSSFKPSMPSENIVGNMIDIKIQVHPMPVRQIFHPQIWPLSSAKYK